MKKLFIFILILIAVLYGYRSLPSEAVGVAVYKNITTDGFDYNYISLPFDAGYTMSSDFDPTGSYINSVSRWNADTQMWQCSSFIGGTLQRWLNTYSITEGQTFCTNAKNDHFLYIAGKYIDIPSYQLVTSPGNDLNMIMHPIEKYDLEMAGSGIGTDIWYCNTVTKWDAVTQSNVTTTSADGLYWVNDYPSSICQPLYVNMTDSVVWPNNNYSKGKDFKIESDVSEVNLPKAVYYRIVNAEGDGFDLSQSTITFKAWISGREDDILTESSYGCGLEQITDSLSAIFINLGNFKNKWLPDDVINFLVTESVNAKSPSKLEGSGSYIVEKNSDAAFRGFDPLVKGSGEPIVVGTPINSEENIPYETALYQNYPNPFNPVTTIKFSLKNDGKVKLNVFNYKGQLVKELVNSDLVKGYHKVDFNASELSSGMYFYSLEADNMKLIKKMVLVR